MYTKNLFLFVAAGASTVSAGSVFAERAIQARDSSNGGWSLQSSSAVSGLTSCGDDAYCPSSFTCFPASQAVAAACCPTSSDCHGAIYGAPSCADSSWSLYKNNQGNGFCCEAGQVGAFDPSATTGAGFCTDSVSSSESSAVLVSSGTGSVSTSVVSSSAASTTDASTTSATTAAVTSSGSTASVTGSGSATKSSSGSSSTTGSSSASATSGATASSSGNSTSASGSASSSATGSSGSSGAVQNAVASGFGLLFAGLAFTLIL